MADTIGLLFMFFGAIIFVGLKFFVGRLLKGIMGLVFSIIISIVLTFAASLIVGFCQPLATFLICGILVLTGLPGVLLVWLAPLVIQMIPGIEGSILPAIVPLTTAMVLLFVVAGIEFALKIFSIVGLLFPPTAPFAEGVGTAMPFIEIGAGLLIMVIIWSAFGTAAGLVPDCLFGNGPSAAIPGTGGVHVGIVK